MKYVGLIGLVLLSLPILLHLYAPDLLYSHSAGALLGTIGSTVSPLILFLILGRFILKQWVKTSH